MALPAYRRTANIRLSFQAAIGNSVAVDSVNPNGVPFSTTVPVYHYDPLADPDEARDPATDPERAFVVTNWLEERAGRRAYSVVQLDVYSRRGPTGAATSDPYGIFAADIADAIEDTFAGNRSAPGPLESVPRAEFPVLDYSTDPTAPTEAGMCLRVEAPGVSGGLGVPQDRRPARVEGGFWRVTLTFAMRLILDAVQGNPYNEANP